LPLFLAAGGYGDKLIRWLVWLRMGRRAFRLGKVDGAG
jgi:hypothetical protein